MSASDNLVLETASEPPEKPPQRRRKGLERKRERPRFCLIPNSNNISSVNLEPEFDYDNPKFKDPEEFFLAYDRHLNAKKEIEKQTGRLSGDFSQNNGSTLAPRPPRRQGLPGFRRSRPAKYRHLYPSVSSQEPIVEDILSPSNHGPQNESVNQDVVLQENEVLASQQGEPGNNAGSILQADDSTDKLLDELLAHDVDDLDGDGAVNLIMDSLQIKPLAIGKLNFPAPRIDLKAPGTNVSKPRDVLSDVHNLFKSRSESPMTQNAMEEDFVKSILQDPASTSQPGPYDMHESLSDLDTDAEFQAEGSTGRERNMEHEAVDSSLPCSMTENQFEQSDYPMDGCFGIQDDASQQIKDIPPKQVQETASEMHIEKNKEPSVVSKEGQVKAKSESRKKKPSRRQQKNEEHSVVVSREGQVKARSQSRNKELSRRQSLAVIAAGTTWTSEGVRRSTRIRSRPLEYWRGERFLYGRIHESLATVIGIKKYTTPKKDGNRNDLVVESFVSDQYQNLVELAAL